MGYSEQLLDMQLFSITLPRIVYKTDGLTSSPGISWLRVSFIDHGLEFNLQSESLREGSRLLASAEVNSPFTCW